LLQVMTLFKGHLKYIFWKSNIYGVTRVNIINRVRPWKAMLPNT